MENPCDSKGHCDCLFTSDSLFTKKICIVKIMLTINS